MLLFVDRFGVIGEHFVREGFGRLCPAAQFLNGPAPWGVFVEAT
jgi:hypothetical protein